jgi:hypothetical protein
LTPHTTRRSPPATTAGRAARGREPGMAKFEVRLKLTISDDSDPEDALEDIQEQVGGVLLDLSEYHPIDFEIVLVND